MATFENKEGESIERAYDILVGADGVNSHVRSELEAKVPEFTVTQKEVRFGRTMVPGLPGAQFDDSGFCLGVTLQTTLPAPAISSCFF